MITKITLDRAGRVLIPKSLRQKLHLGPGAALRACVLRSSPSRCDVLGHHDVTSLAAPIDVALLPCP